MHVIHNPLIAASNSRRSFLKTGGLALAAAVTPVGFQRRTTKMTQADTTTYDVVIIGGSYAGMAAGMALGRALRSVVIIDAQHPANRMTPFSHNFLTQDGVPPAEIAQRGREQLAAYATVQTVHDRAVHAERTELGFTVETMGGRTFHAAKIIFATGITDVMLQIDGFTDCWGKSVLHCPYCHGFEVRGKRTGVIANGSAGFDYALLIANWTPRLTLFTNGPSQFNEQQTTILRDRGITIIENTLASIEHTNGVLHGVRYTDGSVIPLDVVYAKCAFEQHCIIPATLGCVHSPEGYIVVDQLQRTTVDGLYACGDNASPMRTVANAVASGTAAGMHVNKELVMQHVQ